MLGCDVALLSWLRQNVTYNLWRATTVLFFVFCTKHQTKSFLLYQSLKVSLQFDPKVSVTRKSSQSQQWYFWFHVNRELNFYQFYQISSLLSQSIIGHWLLAPGETKCLDIMLLSLVPGSSQSRVLNQNIRPNFANIKFAGKLIKNG